MQATSKALLYLMIQMLFFPTDCFSTSSLYRLELRGVTTRFPGTGAVLQYILLISERTFALQSVLYTNAYPKTFHCTEMILLVLIQTGSEYELYTALYTKKNNNKKQNVKV